MATSTGRIAAMACAVAAVCLLISDANGKRRYREKEKEVKVEVKKKDPNAVLWFSPFLDASVRSWLYKEWEAKSLKEQADDEADRLTYVSAPITPQLQPNDPEEASVWPVHQEDRKTPWDFVERTVYMFPVRVATSFAIVFLAGAFWIRMRNVNKARRRRLHQDRARNRLSVATSPRFENGEVRVGSKVYRRDRPGG